MEKIANFVYDKAKWIILFTSILSIVALASTFRFELDPDFMSLFSQGNPEAKIYADLNNKYQSGEPVSVLIEQEASLLTRNSLIEVFKLQEKVRSITGISQVQSYIPSEVWVEGQFVRVDEEFINNNYVILVNFIEDRYYFADESLSKDGTKGIITAILMPEVPSKEVVESLQSLVGEEENSFQLALAGDAVMKETLRHSIITVLLYIPPFAVGLILLVFIAVIRNLKLTILAMLPAAFAIMWSYGTILWSGQKLNLVTSAAPIFILVLGTVYGLHYVSHFIDNVRNGYANRRDLTVNTMRMVGMPLLLATITTMVGFASLTWTEMMPVRNLGMFATIGIGYAGFLALIFLPAVISRIKPPTIVSETEYTRLTKIVIAASRQRVLVAVIFVAIVGASAFFVPKIEIVSDHLMWFKEDSDAKQVYNKVADNFGGAFPLTGEIIADQDQANPFDAQFANSVLQMERELEGLPSIKSAFSVFDLVKTFNEMITGQDVYPEDPMILQEYISEANLKELDTWVSSDGYRMLIRTGELSTHDIARLEGFVEENNETIRLITGIPIIFEDMNKLVTQSQIRSLALAFGLILLVLLVFLRKLGAALAGLLPIMITVLGILGFLALSGINLHIVTAVLSAICIGVGIDYCIHVLSGIYYYRERGLSNRQSVNAALSVVSGPVLANALGITLGIYTLFFAPLKLYTDAGAVLCLAMLLSAMGALLLIPVFYTLRREGAPGLNNNMPHTHETEADLKHSNTIN